LGLSENRVYQQNNILNMDMNGYDG
jgi:hypothetical protein